MFDAKLAVRRGKSDELAAGELLRRATLVNIHVRSVSANDRVMRLRDRLQSENVCARAAKNKIDRDVCVQSVSETALLRAL